MKYLLLILASLTLSLTSYAQQGLGWWSPVSVPSTGDCGTYRVTRTLADQSWDVWVTYVDCHDVVHTVYLYPPEAMSIVVCASAVPKLSTNAPVLSGAWGRRYGSTSEIIWDGISPLNPIYGTPGTQLKVPYSAVSTWYPPKALLPGYELVFQVHTTMPIGATGDDLHNHAYLRYYEGGAWNSGINYSSPFNLEHPTVVTHNAMRWYTANTDVPVGVEPFTPSGFNPGDVEFLTDGCNPNFIPPGLPEDVDPEAPTVSCGGIVSYGGGRAFPSDNIYTVGSGTGNMEFGFNALSIPDKFILIKADGVNVGDVIHDTGYRGGAEYQSSLNAALTSRGLPTETISGGGAGSVNISKTADYTKVLIRVYAPLGETVWRISLSCP